MIVWQVIDGWDFNVTVGLFSTEALAKAAIGEEGEATGGSLYIDSMTIDGPLLEEKDDDD